jgi:GDPmannose 4,6-dehydratase
MYMKSKVALVTGAGGQDGSYLVPLLLHKGYNVHVVVRTEDMDQVSHLHAVGATDPQDITVHEGSIENAERMNEIMDEVIPDEVYNLAAISHVALSFQEPDLTWMVNYEGAGNVINGALRVNKDARIYQASSSEMFGNSAPPQNERTPFNPQSPYAESKLQAHLDFVIGGRNARGAYVVSGILFNHESPLRGTQFVTRKITNAFVKIAAGMQDTLELGNLNARRDWGHAEDYVRTMHLMLQQDTPDDYVIASGESHSIRDFAETAGRIVGFDILWEGENENEVGRDKKTGNILVRVNPKFYRPQEVNFTQGDYTKARVQLGWKPTHTFESLVRSMIDADRALLKK